MDEIETDKKYLNNEIFGNWNIRVNRFQQNIYFKRKMGNQ